MRRISPILLSLLCNALLLVVLFVVAANGQGWRRAGSISRDMPNRSLRISHSDRPLETAVSNTPIMVVNESFHWAQLESPDYRIYIKNLREVGCPEATIRDMIVAEVDELFAAKVRDLVSPHVPQFWNLLADKERFEKLIDDKAKELREMEDNRREMLRLLLGRDGQDFDEDDHETDEIATAERQRQLYDFLPSGKQEQIKATEQKYAAMTAELYRTGLSAPEKQRRQSELKADKERELSAVLTAEELGELRVRASPRADLRYRLAGFQAGEDELKRIIGVYDKYASAQESKEPNVDLRVAQRAEAQRRQREELVALLGEARFAEFERAQDNNYQEFYRLGQNLSLSQDAVTTLYEQRKQAEELARQLRSDRNLSPEERDSRFAELRERLEGECRSALGQANYGLYRKQGVGRWIDGLR